MLIGSLDIYQKNNKYFIDNINQDENMVMLIESFQLDRNDFSTIFSLSSLKEYMKQVNFNNVTTNNLLRSLYQQLPIRFRQGR